MNVIAKLFEKDGINVFPSKSGEIFSACVDTTLESLDLNTGFLREERLMFWVKASSEESALKNANMIVDNINKGKLIAYRAFSNEPFSAGDTMDINPSTNAPLNRYSQVRLCPVAKFEDLHRQYVVNTPVTTSENVTA